MDIEKAFRYLSMIRRGLNTKTKINSNGGVSSIGALDHNLKQLLRLGLIEKHNEGYIKPYTITKKGQKYLELMED